MTEPTAEQPQVTATVSPAPPRSRWGGIPRHLGRARTSTLVLSTLFLAIGALWINVRPDEPPPPGTVGVDQPVAPTAPAFPIPPAPTSEPAPTTTPEQTTTSEAPPTSSSDVPPTETSPRFPTTSSEPPPPLPDTTSTPTG